MLRKYDKLKLVSLGMLIAFFIASLGLNFALYQSSDLAKIHSIKPIEVE